MSRQERKITKHITLVLGSDHALGQFMQVTDSRYAGTAEDHQGEGYVLDLDDMFGPQINLIGIKEDDLIEFTKQGRINNARIIELTDAFAAKYEGQPKPNG